MLQTPRQFLEIGRAVNREQIIDGQALYALDQTFQITESFSDGLLLSNSIIELFADCAQFCDQTETEIYLRPLNRNFEKLARLYQLDVREYVDGQVVVSV